MLVDMFANNGTAPPPPVPAPVVPTRNSLKAVLLLVLFIATFLASVSALVLKSAARASRASGNGRAASVFSLVSCFGGGVFLSTCLMHLLPESMEQIQRAQASMHWKSSFPFAELCISLGFLFVLIIEQRNWLSDTHQLLHDESGHANESQQQHLQAAANVGDGAESLITDVEPLEDEHFEHETHSAMRAVILVLAISIHAAFEGLAVGMIVDIPTLLQICGALLIHKVIIGVSLGVRLVQSRMRKRTVVYCSIIFSGQILIGGIVGLAIMDVLNRESLGLATFISGILQAFAAGTFLYVTCFEILPHELNKRGYRPGKVATMCAGFALITLFIIIFPDADDDNQTIYSII